MPGKDASSSAAFRPQDVEGALADALKRWVCIFSQDYSSSHTSLAIQLAETEAEAINLVEEVLGGKSDSTVIKRARFVVRMVNWSVERFGTPNIIPVRLNFVLEFLRDLKSAGKFSAMRETVETVAFLEHVCGLDVETSWY